MLTVSINRDKVCYGMFYSQPDVCELFVASFVDQRSERKPLQHAHAVVPLPALASCQMPVLDRAWNNDRAANEMADMSRDAISSCRFGSPDSNEHRLAGNWSSGHLHSFREVVGIGISRTHVSKSWHAGLGRVLCAYCVRCMDRFTAFAGDSMTLP